jgi:hypothetical protein
MSGFIPGREGSVVVDVGIEHAQRDEPPVNAVVTLRDDDAEPYAGHPGK